MTDYGLLSIIPAAVAIILALATKNIVLSLFVSAFLGATIVSGFNPVTGFVTLIKDYMFVQIAEPMNAQALFMMTIISGFVALLTASGGALAFSDKVTNKLNTRSKGETAIWLGGLAIWFTDTGNSIILGPLFETIVERLKISREKFAYILDMTAICDCALIPIIGWGVYTMGLVDTELVALKITDMTAWDIFIRAIPYNFYAILALLLSGYLAFTQFDYGPMLSAQNRAIKTGQTIKEGGVAMRAESKSNLPEGVKPRISTMVIPLIALFVGVFYNLIANGFPFVTVPGKMIRTSIAFGFMMATITLIIICMIRKIMTFTESLNTYLKGMTNATFMCVVLTLAWSLGGLGKTLGTAEYIVSMTKGFLSPQILPAVIFAIGAVISFATGTSWGTMAIMMPVGIPVAVAIGSPVSVVLAATISGGLFGDSSSPVSDTTILASTGAASDHIDFFKCMFPYSLTVGIVSFITFIIAGHNETPVVLLVSLIALFVLVALLHKISLKKHTFETFDTEKAIS